MPKDPSAPSIEVRGLTKRFGSVVALSDLSFTVAQGELFFLLGPSGCGKSTLLRILAGLETADAGEVFFSGELVSRRASHQRGAPMVFQNYALWPHLSVKDNVGFGLVERRVPKVEIAKRVEEALAQVELTGLGQRMPGQLSGGQQQRVALARALVVNPKIVLLDEPLSNLDAKLRLEMRREIERLHERTDLTLIYVTHDQSEALGLADRMAVMEAGRMRALGAPRALYHRPPNRFCARFLGEANLIPGRFMGFETEGARILVRTAFGLWIGVPGMEQDPTFSEQDEVCCMIRPENLRLAANQAEPNAFRAKVGALRLNGSTVSVRVNAEAQEMHATLLSHARMAVQPGEEHWWSAAVEDTVVLGAE